MTIQQSFNRLFWRFQEASKEGSFRPNEKDLEALTFLAEWVNKSKEDILKQNILFAKLYVYLFGQELMALKNIKHAQKNVNELCKKPITYFYEGFETAINESELYNFQKSIGIHPDRYSKTFDVEKIISQNQKALERYFSGIWEYEKVEKSLNNQITEAINKYKNLP